MHILLRDIFNPLKPLVCEFHVHPNPIAIFMRVTLIGSTIFALLNKLPRPPIAFRTASLAGSVSVIILLFFEVFRAGRVADQLALKMFSDNEQMENVGYAAERIVQDDRLLQRLIKQGCSDDILNRTFTYFWVGTYSHTLFELAARYGSLNAFNILAAKEEVKISAEALCYLMDLRGEKFDSLISYVEADGRQFQFSAKEQQQIWCGSCATDIPTLVEQFGLDPNVIIGSTPLLELVINQYINKESPDFERFKSAIVTLIDNGANVTQAMIDNCSNEELKGQLKETFEKQNRTL